MCQKQNSKCGQSSQSACLPARLPSACWAAAEMARVPCSGYVCVLLIPEGALALLAFVQRISNGKACTTFRLLLH